MTKKYYFESGFGTGKKFAKDISNDSIKHEPMFFNSSLNYAYENGGPITRSFIDSLPSKAGGGVFDSRVHMLMPGWYPAIPGLHHDDIPRPEIPVGQHFITAGQPDYDNPRYHSEHFLGLVNGDICPTEFVIGEIELDKVPEGQLIYREWHKKLEAMLEDGLVAKASVPDRTIVNFDWQAFHQGTKAVQHGWRWFGRVSINTDRTKTITNEIRRNAQVYLEFPMEGW